MRALRGTASTLGALAVVVLAGCSTSSSPNSQKVPSLYSRSATAIAELLLPECRVNGVVDAIGTGRLKPGKRTAVCEFSDGALTVKALDTAAERKQAASSGDRLTKTCALVGPGFDIVGRGSLMLNHMRYTDTTVTYETSLHGFCSLRSTPVSSSG